MCEVEFSFFVANETKIPKEHNTLWISWLKRLPLRTFVRPSSALTTLTIGQEVTRCACSRISRKVERRRERASKKQWTHFAFFRRIPTLLLYRQTSMDQSRVHTEWVETACAVADDNDILNQHRRNRSLKEILFSPKKKQTPKYTRDVLFLDAQRGHLYDRVLLPRHCHSLKQGSKKNPDFWTLKVIITSQHVSVALGTSPPTDEGVDNSSSPHLKCPALLFNFRLKIYPLFMLMYSCHVHVHLCLSFQSLACKNNNNTNFV